MSIEKVISLYDGFHFEGELRALNRLADGVTDGVIVAIGSYKGQSDCALALHAHVPVYCIDNRMPSNDVDFGDADRADWMRNVLDIGVAAKVRPINLPSRMVAEVWFEPIHLLFIDGNHDLIVHDLDAWLPHVVEGGLVIVHDNNLPQVLQALAGRTDLVEIERSDLTTVYRKEYLYEPHTFDNLTLLVRKGPYNHDDKYVLGEVRSYDIGDEPVRTLIDVGAHIGAFSAWIHQLYSEASIVAIEPEISGYILAGRNLSDMSSIKLLNARVSYDRADAALYVNPVNSGCHQIVTMGEMVPGKPYVPAPMPVTLEELMEDQKWDRLDLLKIDAEDAEYDVLLNCTDSFLRRTTRIVGEFHRGYDDFMATIGARLQSLDFDVTGVPDDGVSHSTFVAINRNIRPSEDNKTKVEVTGTDSKPTVSKGRRKVRK